MIGRQTLRRTVFVAATIIGIAADAALATPLVSIVPSTKTVTAASTFDLDVMIGSVIDLYAFQFSVKFNPGVLQAVTVSEGPLLPSAGTTAFFPGAIDNTTGDVTAVTDTLVGALAGVTGSGLLGTLRFMALAAGTSSILPFDILLLDSTLTAIAPFDVDEGTVIVRPGGRTTPEPAAVLLLSAGLAAVGWRRGRRTADAKR